MSSRSSQMATGKSPTTCGTIQLPSIKHKFPTLCNIGDFGNSAIFFFSASPVKGFAFQFSVITANQW